MVSQILDSTEDIIKKIGEKGLSSEEIADKIRKKQEEYGGLLTDAGAAYSIAKELGIELDFEPRSQLKIKDLSEGIANVNVTVRVDNAFPTREFDKNGRKGNVTNLAVSDDTGKANLAIWNKGPLAATKGAQIKVLNAYVRSNNGQLEINIGNFGSVSVLKPGAEEQRVRITDLQENSFAEIRATIVELFKPTIIDVCPNCGTMAKSSCPKCGNAEPMQTVIANADLDDGTEVIRGTFYRALGEKLLGCSGKELREKPGLFDLARLRLLGEECVFMGEIKANAPYNRLDFIVRSFNNIDVQKELDRVLTWQRPKS